ncbi:MAG: NAD-dependent epimerase/dehydratase family protein [Proteobacteria bacterium]|nr:NAD-dependent epimerase/dehydratase family protein [Pseudomonadota bacterium]
MTVLVTGASGFVGSAITRALIERGADVAVLVRDSSNQENLESLNVRIRTGDLRDKASLERACKGCDTLFHVAADYRLWTRDSRELYASNVAGTRNLMESALETGIARIVYTSSVATLGGSPDGTPGDETSAVTINDMVGHYKRSKFLAEKVIDDLVETHNLPAVIVNPSTPVGPRDVKPTPTGRLVRDAAAGKMPAYIDTGLNIAHVDDVATGHILALERGAIGRRYILGGENLTLREILNIIASICGRSAPKIRLPRRLVYPVAYVSQAWAWLSNGQEPQATVDGLRMAKKKMFFDSSRAIEELGYQSRPATDALADAIAWFAAHEPRKSRR